MLVITDSPIVTTPATKELVCKQRGYASIYPALERDSEGKVIPEIRVSEEGTLNGAVAFANWPTFSIPCTAKAAKQLNKCLRQDKNGHWYARALVEGEHFTSDVAGPDGNYKHWLENASVQVLAR